LSVPSSTGAQYSPVPLQPRLHPALSKLQSSGQISSTKFSQSNQSTPIGLPSPPIHLLPSFLKSNARITNKTTMNVRRRPHQSPASTYPALHVVLTLSPTNSPVPKKSAMVSMVDFFFQKKSVVCCCSLKGRARKACVLLWLLCHVVAMATVCCVKRTCMTGVQILRLAFTSMGRQAQHGFEQQEHRSRRVLEGFGALQDHRTEGYGSL
jgi:hypothetical protein